MVTRRLSRTPRLGNIKQAGQLLALVIVPTTLISSLMAGLACQMIYGRGALTLGTQWFAGHGLVRGVSVDAATLQRSCDDCGVTWRREDDAETRLHRPCAARHGAVGGPGAGASEPRAMCAADGIEVASAVIADA